MRNEHLPIQNIPIPLTPEQRELSRKLKQLVLLGRGYTMDTPPPIPIDYASLERRVADRLST